MSRQAEWFISKDKRQALSPAEPKRKRMPGYWFASRRRYFEKNHGRFYARLTDLSLVERAHVLAGPKICPAKAG